MEHDRQLLETRNTFFFIAWLILIIIVLLVSICRKLRGMFTRVEGEREQHRSTNSVDNDNEFNDNATIPVGNDLTVEEQIDNDRRSLILKSIIHKVRPSVYM